VVKTVKRRSGVSEEGERSGEQGAEESGKECMSLS